MDATRYAEKLPKKLPTPGTKESKSMEKTLKRRYPLPNGVTISMPCIIVDTDGIIVTWYLPGILSDSRQVCCLPCPIVEENLMPLRVRCWQRKEN